jgi:hypothetical protein
MSIVIKSDLAADNGISQGNDQPHVPTSCDIYTKLTSFIYDFYRGGRKIKLELGNMTDVLKGTCKHVTLFKDLESIWKDEEGTRWKVDEEPAIVNEDGPQSRDEDRRRVSVDELKDRANLIAYNVNSWYFSFEATVHFEATIPRLLKNCGSLTQQRGINSWQLAWKDDISHHLGTAMVLDNHWINVDVVWDWIKSCDACHRGICRRGPLSQEHDIFRPRYLVDCIRNFVASGHEAEAAYVALSYQWGQTNNLRNTKQLCERLLQPSCLAVADIASRIPWTFQEYLLSNRKLTFLNGRVEWRCNGGTRYEDQVNQHQVSVDGKISKDWFGSAIPTLKSLEQLVQVYARRKMSFPEDAFAAFAGVQTMLERLYQSHFTYGLSEVWFDIALNWFPMQRSSSKTLFERRHTSGLKDSIMVSHQLPSWS